MGLKIFGLGFIVQKNSYLRTFWNWMDFIIVTTGYIPFILQDTSSVNITSLRTLRVLRPLRAISFLKELRQILTALVKGLPDFLNVMVIYLFFLCFFAISALQLLEGILKRRCFESFTGLILQGSDPSTIGVLCGHYECPGDYVCGKLIQNPNYNITNFDNILWSLAMIFQTFTSNFNSYYVGQTFNHYGGLAFFIIGCFLGVFLLVNLMISVISSAYKSEQERKNEVIQNLEEKRHFAMTTYEYKKQKYLNFKKLQNYLIITDSSIEYISENLDDVLPSLLEREKEQKKIEFEKEIKSLNSKIRYNLLQLSDEEKKIINYESKGIKKIIQLNINIQDPNSKNASEISIHKNLPLKISKRRLNFNQTSLCSDGQPEKLFPENLFTGTEVTTKRVTAHPFEKEDLIIDYQRFKQIINDEIYHQDPSTTMKEFENEEIYAEINVYKISDEYILFLNLHFT